MDTERSAPTVETSAPAARALPAPTMPPAGWYPQPGVPGVMRYWSGAAWADAPLSAGRTPFTTLPLWVAVVAVALVLAPLVASRPLLQRVSEAGLPAPLTLAVGVLVAYGPSLWWWRYAARRLGVPARPSIGLAAQRADAGWGPVTWLCCIAAQLVVGLAVVGFNIPTARNTDTIREARDNSSYVVSIVILAVLVAPIVEELIFRGLVLRGLASVAHPAVAVAAQGVLFGAAHADPSYGTGNIGLVLVLSGVGAVLGGAAYLFRRLAPSMIAHAIINAIAVSIALSGWQPPA
jgi:uncharacterized protein